MPDQANVLELIRAERDRQDRKWGVPSSLPRNRLPDRWLAILMEEIGEVSKHTTELGALREAEGSNDTFDLRALRHKALHKELVEAASVIVSWLEWWPLPNGYDKDR